MNKNRLFTKLCFILVIIGLSACNSHKSKNTQMDALSVANADAQTQSYALQQNQGYSTAVSRDENGEIINSLKAPTNQTYYFNFASNVVKDHDYEAITIQAKYLAAHPNIKVRLEGNTDNRGSREYNIGLGWRRDQAVERILQQYGVQASQINMVSYGKERPAVDEDNQTAWRLNRRVNLVYEVNNAKD